MALGIAQPAAAQAEHDSGDSAALSDTEESDLRSFWDENGVTVDVQDSLIAKLEAGLLWDVFTGVEPVSTRTVTSQGTRSTIDTYADGSVSVTTVQIPTRTAERGIVTPMSVGNCRSGASGTGYSNWYDCQAYSETGVVGIGFYISYSLTPGYDSIISVNSPYGASAFGTLNPNPPTLTLVKKTETASGSAWAKATTTYIVSGGVSSSSLEMRALVGGNTAWTRWESGLT